MTILTIHLDGHSILPSKPLPSRAITSSSTSGLLVPTAIFLSNPELLGHVAAGEIKSGVPLNTVAIQPYFYQHTDFPDLF